MKDEVRWSQIIYLNKERKGEWKMEIKNVTAIELATKLGVTKAEAQAVLKLAVKQGKVTKVPHVKAVKAEGVVLKRGKPETVYAVPEIVEITC